MSLLNDTDRQKLKIDAFHPIPKVDDETHLTFYVISADFFEQVRPLIPDEKFEPREFAPLMSRTAAAAGWDDPAMDIYDHYDDARAAH